MKYNLKPVFDMQHMSLAKRIILQIGIPVLLTLTLVISVLTCLLRDQETERIRREARMIAQSEALKLTAYINEAAFTVRTIASVTECIAGKRSGDRIIISELLENSLRHNPNLLSTWCAFERNSLYDPDTKWANTPYGNNVGRYTTGINKAKGYISRDITPESGMVPGDGDWYIVPRDKGTDTLIDPYDWAYYEGTPAFFETSYAVPVRHNGKIIGVAGADIGLDSLADHIRSIHPYGKGCVAIIANNATYAATPIKSLQGKDIGKSAEMNQIREALQDGSQVEFTRYDKAIGGTVCDVVIPITIGASKERWALLVCVPMREAMAPMYRTIYTGIAISVVASIGLFVLLMASANRIAGPIKRLSSIADCWLKVMSKRLTRFLKLPKPSLSF